MIQSLSLQFLNSEQKPWMKTLFCMKHISANTGQMYSANEYFTTVMFDLGLWLKIWREKKYNIASREKKKDFRWGELFYTRTCEQEKLSPSPKLGKRAEL